MARKSTSFGNRCLCKLPLCCMGKQFCNRKYIANDKWLKQVETKFWSTKSRIDHSYENRGKVCPMDTERREPSGLERKRGEHENEKENLKMQAKRSPWLNFPRASLAIKIHRSKVNRKGKLLIQSAQHLTLMTAIIFCYVYLDQLRPLELCNGIVDVIQVLFG